MRVSFDTNLENLTQQPHHDVRHQPDAKKPRKHSLDESVIMDILRKQCDCSSPCYLNFSVKDVIVARQKFDYNEERKELTENELSVKLVSYLSAHSFENREVGTHRIGEKFYRLILNTHPGVFLCPTAFCSMLGFCPKKLRKCARHFDSHGTDIDEPLPHDEFHYAPKTDSIVSFLVCLSYSF